MRQEALGKPACVGTNGTGGTGGTNGTGGTGGTGIQAAGGTFYTLEFTNVSHRSCSLFGYPEVSAYAGDRAAGGPDSPVGMAAIRDTSVRPKPVMLAPGATAHAVLRVIVVSTPPARCAQVTSQELRVTLPRQGLPAFVPAHIAVCSQKGPASLSVQAIQARPGVPATPWCPDLPCRRGSQPLRSGGKGLKGPNVSCLTPGGDNEVHEYQPDEPSRRRRTRRP